MRLPSAALPAAVVPAVAAAALALVPTAAFAEGPPKTFVIEDPRITESSGLAASRIHPGVYWTHNDSEDGPYVYGVDAATGRTVARVTMTGVGRPRDVEAISLGPDGQLYVGDIGDNRNGTWDHVWIYRFPEPKQLGDSTVKAAQFTVKYADGPRDAEALMVHPKTGRVYIASKDKTKGGLYEGPAQLSTGGTNVFRRVAAMPWVTDGAFSPDGTRLAVRGYLFARTYPFRDGRPSGEGDRVDAPWQGQAESVTYSADGSALMMGAEGPRSEVVAVPVAPPAGGAPGASGKPSARPGGSGPGGTAAAQDTGTGNLTVGGLVLAGAVALWLGGRRLFRRARG
ncbi:WD40 repeat domain-containing protein [Streptomyces sp. NPDC089799]|uniref:WD40 repeat domain-containing protein n=1 Tax=Streptomyces sp. NPDC089799 TaxID=3155066 RepID=UPI003436E20C